MELLQLDEQTEFNGIKIETSDSIPKDTILIIGPTWGNSLSETLSDLLKEKAFIDEELAKSCSLIVNIK